MQAGYRTGRRLRGLGSFSERKKMLEQGTKFAPSQRSCPARNFPRLQYWYCRRARDGLKVDAIKLVNS